MGNRRMLFVVLTVVLLFFLPAGIQRARAGTFTTCASVTEIPVSECNALVALYNNTNGAGWYNHTNWLVTDTPSNWHGVTVTGGTVTVLGLTANGLNGSLPPELGNLTNLQYLILDANQISGSLPPQL
jgi:hypothetical protein